MHSLVRLCINNISLSASLHPSSFPPRTPLHLWAMRCRAMLSLFLFPCLCLDWTVDSGSLAWLFALNLCLPIPPYFHQTTHFRHLIISCRAFLLLFFVNWNHCYPHVVLSQNASLLFFVHHKLSCLKFHNIAWGMKIDLRPIREAPSIPLNLHKLTLPSPSINSQQWANAKL